MLRVEMATWTDSAILRKQTRAPRRGEMREGREDNTIYRVVAITGPLSLREKMATRGAKDYLLSKGDN